MSTPALVIVAHGTRDERGTATLTAVADHVGEIVAAPVHCAFADVAEPTVASRLAEVRAGDVVVVPAFLASGYHVRVDLPAQLRAAGSPERRCILAPAIGPHPDIAAVQAARLRAAGLSPGDAVVMAAVGSSDPHARADVHRAGELVSAVLNTPVRTALCTGGADDVGTLSVETAVAAARSEGARRVAVSAYVLAEGRFWSQITAAGADVVAGPIGTDRALAGIIVRRMHEALSRAKEPRRTSEIRRGPGATGPLTPAR